MQYPLTSNTFSNEVVSQRNTVFNKFSVRLYGGFLEPSKNTDW